MNSIQVPYCWEHVIDRRNLSASPFSGPTGDVLSNGRPHRTSRLPWPRSNLDRTAVFLELESRRGVRLGQGRLEIESGAVPAVALNQFRAPNLAAQPRRIGSYSVDR